ncbi:hypothetical protein [Sphingomonas sp. CCH15-F11]|uniref:hypothetical protein n=1 Tax=Sphingomonas sp. CCH15-F11 TaxID=1768785 RepID=UPI00082ED139|nr:hypothetical protein [Sphingomonas sp. CCH15-F11]
MAEWQPASTAPRDGTQFLGLLSNGWYALLSGEPNCDWPYQWWRSDGRHQPPILETHPTDTDWSATYSLLLTRWMPLPAPPTDA